MDTTVRSSRGRLVAILAAVAAVHAGVILTSDREGPGSAQLRLGASDSLVSPEGLLVAALLAALAFACAALLFGTRTALARPPSAAGPSRRAFLLSAGGGAASLALAWSLRGRAGSADPPAVPTAVAAAAPPPSVPTAAADVAVPAAPPTVAPTSAVATVAPTAVPPPTATTAAMPTTAAIPTAAPLVAASPTAPIAAGPSIAAAAAPAPAGYDEPPANAAAPTPRPAAAAPTAAPPATAAAAPKPAAPPKAVRQPTQTMPGGRNNYSPNAPLVPNLGKGFLVAGTVLDTNGEPVGNTRIQIWLNTARGGEREPSNRGSVMTDALGKYRLETSPVSPVFGQPHVHIGYDDGKYNTLFLRPVLKSERDPSITVDFVLGSTAAA